MVRELRDLAGQAQAAERLASAVATGRVHHAWLFVGPGGTGKLTAAKLFAQLLLCTGNDADKTRPCGTCPACYKITYTGHADVHFLEPDDKDSIKVDAIREATQTLQLRPMEARFRVLIVRDADRMNPQAQNALLKTLEEPPGNSKLVLTTSRPQAILPTVLSRCQRVPFSPVSTKQIAGLLVREKGVPESSALLLAALAQGAPGRALEADAELIVSARDKAAEIDRALFGRTPSMAREALAKASELVELEDGLYDVLSLLGVWLRDQILLASSSQNAELANADRAADLQALAQERGLHELLRRANVVEQTSQLLAGPYNYNTQMVVEQLCLALTGLGRIVPQS